MALEFLAYELAELENKIKSFERNEERRLLRETENPFDLADNTFMQLFRLNKSTANTLSENLCEKLRKQRITGISFEKQVLTAIRFYATGCYQGAVGEQDALQMSQASVSRCIHNVTDAINDTIFRQWIRFPMTVAERHVAKEEFENSHFPFPGAMGAIDCTQISILAPSQFENSYVNHHGFHSLNVQMICDPNLKILNVNARYPGARHDAYIWNSSSARKVMERAYRRGERETFLIGDSGYPLEQWIMTPLPNEREGTPRYRYNGALCSARNCIERCFGVMKATWRCCSRSRVLQYEPGFAGRIVNSCAVLHNMRAASGNLTESIEQLDEVFPNPSSANSVDEMNDLPNLSIARRIQDRIILQRFT